MDKRVELHCHTKMSEMTGLCDIQELILKAAELGVEGIAITDTDSVQSFPNAYHWLKLITTYESKRGEMPADRLPRVFFGLEIRLRDDAENGSESAEKDTDGAYCSIIIAKSIDGVRAIYRLLTAAFAENPEGRPILSKKLLNETRSELIIGSCAEGSEVMKAVKNGTSDAGMKDIMGFYDFVEVEPVENMLYPMNPENAVLTEDEAQEYIARIVSLGKKFGIPVVASSNVYYVKPSDKEALKVLRYNNGNKDLRTWKPAHHLMTARELAQKFVFLGVDSFAIAVDNPLELVKNIKTINPIESERKIPVVPNAFDDLKSFCYEKAHQLYGESLPPKVSERLENELEGIKRSGFESIYMIAQKLIRKSNEAGYIVGSRGSAGASLVAFLSGITEINPLPPHYYCKDCGYADFDIRGIDGFNIGDVGADLPDRICPKCGRKLMKDGYDIPAETFLGFRYDKEPDFDLNFAIEYQKTAWEELGRIEGIGGTYHAGTIGTLAERTALNYAKAYYGVKRTIRNEESIARVAERLTDVKKCEGLHPGGIVVVPEGDDILSVTPVQKHGSTPLLKTHLEYHAIDHAFLKMDILGHSMPSMLKALKNDTGLDPLDIPLNDPRVMSFFTDVRELGISPEQIGGIKTGTLGIGVFDQNEWLNSISREIKPEKISDLIRIFGLSYGTGVWINNIDDLFIEGKAKLHECIANRDDIMLYLISKGMDRENAFKIMEGVRKGRFSYGKELEKLEKMKEYDVPEWYTEACRKILYLFPKAHSANYVLLALRLLYYKLYYPEFYYRRWIEIYAEAVNLDFARKGYDHARQTLEDLYNTDPDELLERERRMMEEIPVILEMYARGVMID